MSMDDFKDDDMLAAELAMGLLEGDEAKEAACRAAEEPGFAARVTAWEMQFAGMAEELDPVAPSPSTKRDVMARVFGEEKPKSLWQRLWVWQATSVVSAVLLAVILLTDFGAPPETGPLYSAEIVSDEGDFRVVALVDKRRDEIVLTRTAGAVPEGRILQVWAHGPGEPAESVGLWPDGDTVRLALPPRIAAVDGVLTIGVSEEPPGGSTTGSPSGRVFGTVDIPGVTPVF